MKYVKMKITGYDEQSQSLLVSFASDTTQSSDPAEYPSFAFQPVNMWPDIKDVEEIKKRIAVAGIYHAEQQATQEAFVADETRVAALKALVGQEASFSVSELTKLDATTPLATV